ncbi:ABC transporter ATP-binding protein [Marihabitans asiaticum]|uniref:ABC-2 type transport system ATP-binding protein n=1 Tax=Marihabitans asiaticum TaxID=415218 RepID=A0A560W825_9MICO|nr:ABC transporter ATP-binding protein [Marihabitans asiaticum]TWD13729.1 ABC-2 type transport system ATP-binding protein [Marihabitans asiaticum]
MTRGADPAPALRLRGVSKSFARGRDRVHAVRDVDLEIGEGEVVAVLGPNGAGKTTTLDMVLGLTEPSSGEIEVFGLAPRRAVDAGRISAVLQTGGLLRDLTVEETVRVIASTFETSQPVAEVMERAGISSLARRKVSKCSGGEQQRLRFALALLPDPDLLVLDEPTAGMDVAARRDFWATMHAEAAQGRTVVFATHYLEEANTFAERIVLLSEGSVVADDTTEAIRARATGRVVAADVDPAHDEELRSLPGVHSVARQGRRVTVLAADSDALARSILLDLGGHDLEITTGSLDEAFIALTSPRDQSTTKSAQGDPR